MVDKKIVLESVKRMIDSGLDDEIIISTLKDVGLSKKEIEHVLKEAGGEGIASKEPAAKKAEEIPLYPEPLTNHHHAIKRHSDESDLQHSITHNILDEHAAKVEGVQDSVQSLHQKMDFMKDQSAVPTPELASKIDSMKERLESFEADLKELKALTSAVHDLLKKILETNRQILSKMRR